MTGKEEGSSVEPKRNWRNSRLLRRIAIFDRLFATRGVGETGKDRLLLSHQEPDGLQVAPFQGIETDRVIRSRAGDGQHLRRSPRLAGRRAEQDEELLRREQ